MEEEAESEKNNFKFKMLQTAVPDEYKSQLTDVDKQVQNLNLIIGQLNEILFRSGWKHIITLGLIIVIFLLCFYREYQAVVLQSYLTFLLSQEFLSRSIVGRVWRAVLSYNSRRITLAT